MRTLRESAQYTAEINAIGSIKRLDEVLHGVTFTLARHPQGGMQTLNPRVWAIEGGAWEADQILIYYSFNDQVVELLSVRLVSGP